jgi:hypothetical protein
MDIVINQGDNYQFTETITGLTSLSGYTAKMYIFTRGGADVDEVSGTIDGLKIYYVFLHSRTKDYTAGKHEFETKLYDTANSLQKTPSEGQFVINKVHKVDPT